MNWQPYPASPWARTGQAPPATRCAYDDHAESRTVTCAGPLELVHDKRGCRWTCHAHALWRRTLSMAAGHSQNCPRPNEPWRWSSQAEADEARAYLAAHARRSTWASEPSTGQLADANTALAERSVDPPRPLLGFYPTGEPPAPAREGQVIEEVRAGFAQLTWPIIVGAIGLGFASAIGNALGTLLVERYITRRIEERRRRS